SRFGTSRWARSGRLRDTVGITFPPRTRPWSAPFGQEVRLSRLKQMAGGLSPFPRTGCFRISLRNDEPTAIFPQAPGASIAAYRYDLLARCLTAYLPSRSNGELYAIHAIIRASISDRVLPHSLRWKRKPVACSAGRQSAKCSD